MPAVTRDRVKDATKNDPILSQLMEFIKKGIPDEKQQRCDNLPG